jgi:hypothetical protein
MWTKVEGAWVAVLPDAWQCTPLVIIVRPSDGCAIRPPEKMRAEAYIGTLRALSAPGAGALCVVSALLNLWRGAMSGGDTHNPAGMVEAIGRTVAWAASLGVPSEEVPMDSPWARDPDWSWTATMAGGFRGKDVVVEAFDKGNVSAACGEHLRYLVYDPEREGSAIVEAVRGLITYITAREAITVDDLRQLAAVMDWAEGLPKVPHG